MLGQDMEREEEREAAPFIQVKALIAMFLPASGSKRVAVLGSA